ncbi:MAG TPA: hypothetical protein VGR00_08195 [Thermoanaerobaculia bacterium]|nr:hypothetical protein [Thermoanaerobaculia bacterium]
MARLSFFGNASPGTFAAFRTAFLSFVLAGSGALVAQTPTPTPTPSPTPTPTPTPIPVAVPAAVGYHGIPNAGRIDAANIVLENDGTLWSASGLDNVVAKLSADQAKVTRWTFPLDAAPSSLLRENDGTFWITELGGFKVAKFDPASSNLTEWVDIGRRPTALVKNPDGTFWLPETGGTLAKFDPRSGLFTYYKAKDVLSLAYPWSDGDGSLWTCDFLVAALLKFSPDGSKVTKWPLPDAFSSPSKIIRGTDGYLWISLYNTGQLARFDPATNEIKTYSLSFGSLPYDLANYKNRIAYSEQGSGFIGFLDTAQAQPALTMTLTPTDIMTTVATTQTSVPTTTTLVSTTDDVTPAVSLGVSGAAVPAYTELPAGIGAVYGFVIDGRRARIYFNTSGNIGALGPPAPITDKDLYVPSAASVAGVGGTRWATQTVVWNRGTPDATTMMGKDENVTERLLPDGWITGFAPGAPLVVPPGKITNQNDVIGVDMGAPDNFGGLRLAGSQPDDLFAFARVYRTRDDGGTYGFARNAVMASRGIGTGEKGFLFTPPDTSTQRTNAGILVISDTVGSISIVDAQGNEKVKYDFDWPGGYHVQGSTIFSALGVDPVPGGRVAFSVTTGRILPFGTSIDAVTNDPIDLLVFGPSNASTIQWLSGLARGAGPMGASSSTDLQLFNPGTTDATATLLFFPGQPFSGSAPLPVAGSAIVAVPAGKVVTLVDVLASRFPAAVASGAVGSLAIVSDQPIDAFARVTAADSGGGRFGYGTAGLRGNEAVYDGSRGVFIATTDSGFDKIQSDLYLTNPTDTPATVALNLTDTIGTAVGTKTVTLAPKEVRYLPSVWYTIAGFGTDTVGRLDVVPAAGSGQVFATLLRQDRKTGDTDAIPPAIIAK